jgi:DNA-binding NarL/FixJ family response regulator
VLLVDGQRLFREGIRALLQRSPKVRVVDDAASTSEAIAKALKLRPDVVLTAFLLPGEERGALVRELHRVCPETPVVVLAGSGAEEALSQALQHGAQGFVLKDATADLVVKALKAVCAGEVWVQREAMTRGVGQLREQPGGADHRPNLSPRQLEVLRLLAVGASTDKIAGALYVSPSTVRVHIAGVFRKLQVRNRIEAVRKALKQGLVDS